jgi:hypothetical protein
VINGIFAHSWIPVRFLDFVTKGEVSELELSSANEDTDCDRDIQE